MSKRKKRESDFEGMFWWGIGLFTLYRIFKEDTPVVGQPLVFNASFDDGVLQNAEMFAKNREKNGDIKSFQLTTFERLKLAEKMGKDIANKIKFLVVNELGFNGRYLLQTKEKYLILINKAFYTEIENYVNSNLMNKEASKEKRNEIIFKTKMSMLAHEYFHIVNIRSTNIVQRQKEEIADKIDAIDNAGLTSLYYSAKKTIKEIFQNPASEKKILSKLTEEEKTLVDQVVEVMYSNQYQYRDNKEGVNKFRKLNTQEMIKNASGGYYDNSRIYLEQKANLFGTQYVAEIVPKK